MPWGNPIVGGNGVLIRDEIRSTNYVAGVSGWIIRRNGTVEFADGVFRGTIFVPGDYESGVTIRAADSGVNGVEISLDPPGIPPFTDGYIPGLIQALPGLEVGEDDARITITSPHRFNTDVSSMEIVSANSITGKVSFVRFNARTEITGPLIWGIEEVTTVDARDTNTTNGTTTSTSYTNSLTTTGIRGVKFNAPPSGKVMITATCNASGNTVNMFHFLGIEVREGAVIGSGSVFEATDENIASVTRVSVVTMDARHTVTILVEGLADSVNDYNACLTYRVTAGTGSFNRRSIVVTPVL